MIGLKIQELRKANKLTVRELAEKAEITHSMVSNFENNKKIPGDKVIEKLARAFNIPKEDFLKELETTVSKVSPISSDYNFRNKLKQAESLKSEEAIWLVSRLIDFCLEQERIIDTIRGAVR